MTDQPDIDHPKETPLSTFSDHISAAASHLGQDEQSAPAGSSDWDKMVEVTRRLAPPGSPDPYCAEHNTLRISVDGVCPDCEPRP